MKVFLVPSALFLVLCSLFLVFGSLFLRRERRGRGVVNAGVNAGEGNREAQRAKRKPEFRKAEAGRTWGAGSGKPEGGRRNVGGRGLFLVPCSYSPAARRASFIRAASMNQFASRKCSK